MKMPAEIVGYYERFPEESRLETGPFRLEFERTKEILSRLLPRPPARIIDVGGAAGAYSLWLADQGYEMHLLDLSERLVEEARRRSVVRARPIASMAVADARTLPQPNDSAAVVLELGPLYHLTERSDRRAALQEAFRVLAMAGVVIVGAISRYASALDGLARKLTGDPAFVRMRDRDLLDGQHRNESGHPDYFTTAYFHRPEDLQAELVEAGFQDVAVLGVEGPAWMLPDFDSRWSDPALRQDIFDTARSLEAEASILGASAHLLGIGRKRT